MFIIFRPYKGSTTTKTTSQPPKKKHQIYINVDHPLGKGGKITTNSNLPQDPQVSQVIEPVVNTITNAIKNSFDVAGNSNYVNDYYYPSANRRENSVYSSNELDNYGYNYGYGQTLDYYNDYDENLNSPAKMPYASNNPQVYTTMERLRDLKNIYSPPTKKRRKRPYNTQRSEESYYVPRRKKIKYY